MVDPTFVTDAAPSPVRLLDQVRARIRVEHYALRTEKVYVDRVKRFVRFHRMRHPRDRGAAEVEAFLSHLAVDRQVSASTKNQAKAALLSLPITPHVRGVRSPSAVRRSVPSSEARSNA